MNEWDLFLSYRDSGLLNFLGCFIESRIFDYEKFVEEVIREWLVWYKIFR